LVQTCKFNYDMINTFTRTALIINIIINIIILIMSTIGIVILLVLLLIIKSPTILTIELFRYNISLT
jgi:hypothetical protein